MLGMYYKDFDGNKDGIWGVSPNKLIRYDLENNELYHYVFKHQIFGTSLPSILFNSIVDPLTLILNDGGQIMPMSFMDKYKFYGKVTTEYYHVKNQLELQRNMDAIKHYTKPVKRYIKPKKSTPLPRPTNNFQSRLDDMVKQVKKDTHGYNSNVTANNSYAMGWNNKTTIGHSGNVTNLSDLNHKIKEIMKRNEDRVRRGSGY